jgi:hypothetical protein
MAAKAEISWKRRTDEGERLEIYAHHVGSRWKFYVRSRRYERWEPLEQPPLEDWLALLDSVRRRVARRLLRPEEVERVEKSIRENFPEAELK